jgi:hypothetical protein
LIAILAALALTRLGYEFWRLVLDTSSSGAIDLRWRMLEVEQWLAGMPLYELNRGAVYPPATMLLLLPLVGWLSFPAARVLFAILTMVTLVWMAKQFDTGLRPASPAERLCLVLFLLANYATVISIGNGQLSLLVLPFLIAAILRLARRPESWRNDLLSAVLVVFACVKPHNTIPFLWLVLLTPRRIRPAFLVGAIYIALTVTSVAINSAAAPTVPAPPVSTATVEAVELDAAVGTAVSKWFERAEGAAGWSAMKGYANLHTWLQRFGLPGAWNLPGSLLLFFALGVFVYRHRSADPWLLLGVAGLVARIWSYHRVYDDVLVLPALLALVRVLRRSGLSPGARTLGVSLGLASSVMLLLPASLRLQASPWGMLFTSTQSILWIVLIAYLAWALTRLESASAPSALQTEPG